jgi:hypothetical protein
MELVTAGVEPAPVGAPVFTAGYFDRSIHPGSQDGARDKGRNRDSDHRFVGLGISAPRHLRKM